MGVEDKWATQKKQKYDYICGHLSPNFLIDLVDLTLMALAMFELCVLIRKKKKIDDHKSKLILCKYMSHVEIPTLE